jgi:hypothetical protein
MNIRKATIDDTEILVRLRFEYLLEDRGSLTQYEKIKIASQLEKYYKTHINQDFIAIL